MQGCPPVFAEVLNLTPGYPEVQPDDSRGLHVGVQVCSPEPGLMALLIAARNPSLRNEIEHLPFAAPEVISCLLSRQPRRVDGSIFEKP